MSTRHSHVLFAALLVLALAGCPPAEEGTPDGLVHAEWEEEDDDQNGSPVDPEPVDVHWTGSVTILGEMEDCGWDEDENWPWTGDEDNYEIEVPADGYLDVKLTWEENSDNDMLIYYEPPGPPTISPDEQLSTNDDDGEIVFLFEEEHEEGDLVVIAVLCAWGADNDYELLVHWED
jgi:hypothetical protein